ncbi:hypothetical protein [Adhaeribacter pallidiroseus]|uniref:Uncharacterized protein n=1 Tax=Adhaeribacter pallidiroseus TaxID=2072847 RepID=A0A369QDI2_9BACT|nr:hypothetical protein [Adhaeribacter pallidiroseus]RDC62472.1 hypothetical protein AHMF7616_01066 [Adhaeribacter pallidiroseus]
MPSFKETKLDLRQIEQQHETQRLAVFRAREELKKINREKANLLRSNTTSEAYKLLLEREQAIQNSLPELEKNLAEILNKKNSFREIFQTLADPRRNIGQFSDNFPILLFPVRLETRFKKIMLPTGAPQHQLWVRIFPDDCSIDTFDGTLTEAEVKKVKNYWISVWKAGQSTDAASQNHIQNLKKGAWRELLGNGQAGRAYWTIGQYQPLNLAALPQRQRTDEVILVIPTEDLPTEEEQKALRAYWKAVWEANSNALNRQSALDALVAVTGSEKAQTLLQTYIPASQEPPAAGSPVPTAQVAFVQFPKMQDTATKQQSWSQAPRITTFPERFVLMGYKNNTDVFSSQVGLPVPNPLIIGPDPLENLDEVLQEAYANGEIGDNTTAYESLKEEDKVGLYVAYLSKKADTRWLFDFDAAVRQGLGFKVDLTGDQYLNGFDRLLVLGVKLGYDEKEGQEALESLMQHHHFGTSGLALLPQGTPTNNTETSGSGYSGQDDPDETFERYILGNAGDDPEDRQRKKDGRWLAEMLGISAEASTLKQVANYYHTDQSEAHALNTALWPATIGYFMESMLTPVFTESERNIARWYFTNHVIGRGRVPALRIGNQPYGILPTAAISRLKWIRQEGGIPIRGLENRMPVIQKIYQLLSQVRQDWTAFQNNVAHVGKTGDAHQILLEVLGLQASSLEFYQRYAEGFVHLYNYLLWFHPYLGKVAFGASLFQSLTPRQLLRRLGYDANNNQDQPPILEKAFFSKANELKGPFIDDRPLSETQPIRAYTPDGKNYLEWLWENALTNPDRMRIQEGFTENRVPRALLYQMLRHALNLSFSDTGLRLYRRAQILNDKQIQAARIDANFIGFPSTQEEVGSKWEYLFRAEERIAPGGITVAQHIAEILKKSEPSWEAGDTQDLVQALEYLVKVPTARLERAFAEHLDCCTYRLDAWLLGLVNMQLFGMRYGGDFESVGPARPGIYIGAFGWVENLKPDPRTLTPAELPEELHKIFNEGETTPLLKDSTNAGYIHAPSLNQAVTAAVLRNAYLANASPTNPEVFKVNLSSERVRMALGIIEGMQQGQSLGALLGYQLERGLHDRYEEAEVDFYIYELRKAFPIASNRLVATAVPENEQDSVTQTEARNVVDGLALVEHIQKTGSVHYPFDKTLEPVTTPGQQAAIDAEVERIRNINDAVADLAMAESVHQVVQGNYARAAGTLDAYSKGSYPQLPEVVQTPRSGKTLTHRVGIHLPAAAVAPAGANARVLAEPALNEWLASLLPPAVDIVCQITYQLPSTEAVNPNPVTNLVVSMAQLNLAPLDLIYLVGGANEKSLTALDDYLLRYLYAQAGETLRPDIDVKIQYAPPVADKVTFFELVPFINSLRSLVLAARPLRPSDITLPSEADKASDQTIFLDRNRLAAPLAQLKATITAGDAAGSVPDFISLIPANLADPAVQTTVVQSIDDYIIAFTNQLHRVSIFGIPQAGYGFVYDRKRSLYAAIFKKILNYASRWEENLSAYEDLVTAQFAAATTEEARFAILQKAEMLISTAFTLPLPAEAAQYKTDLAAGKETAFRAKLALIRALVDPPYVLTLSGLATGVLALATTLPSLATFDLVPLDIAPEIKQILILTEDMLVQAQKLQKLLTDKITQIENLLVEHDSLADTNRQANLLAQAAKILLGEDFAVFPGFRLSALQQSELTNCYTATDQLLTYQKNELEVKVDFPVDDWLYGVARVREKIGHWENTVMLAEGWRNSVSLDLTPLQLPYRPADSWLALAYPESLVIDQDKLLYTAYWPNFDPSQPQSGILIDEWTEVIPATKETTGLTFHYDKPNHEPPQSLLLITPTEFTGNWQWPDLVDALHETLDLARTRAIEPVQVDGTPYAHFLPATVSAVTVHPATIALNYAINNNLSTD